MIRVLHYGMSPNLGGIETYLLNLARTIDESRFHFDFLYSDQGQPPVFAKELASYGSQFYGVTPRRSSPRQNRHDLEALFAQQSFDILHFHANTASYVEPVKAALRHGVRVVYHSHNAGASRSRLTRALHRWHQRTLPWDRITSVAVSREAGQWMFGRAPYEVIHNGIDVEAFAFNPEWRQSVREALGVGPDTLVVGSVAAFLPAKNHPFVVRVFGEVAARVPDSRLMLVGSGPQEDQVRDLVRQHGLEDRVLFLSRRSDVPELLSAMDYLLLPSLHEGFPLVSLEAQASGLRCLISDTITSEVVVGPHCVQMPLTSPEAWVNTMITGTEIPDRKAAATAMQETGVSKAQATQRVAALYERLMGGQNHQ